MCKNQKRVRNHGSAIIKFWVNYASCDWESGTHVHFRYIHILPPLACSIGSACGLQMLHFSWQGKLLRIHLQQLTTTYKISFANNLDMVSSCIICLLHSNYNYTNACYLRLLEYYNIGLELEQPRQNLHDITVTDDVSGANVTHPHIYLTRGKKSHCVLWLTFASF